MAIRTIEQLTTDLSDTLRDTTEDGSLLKVRARMALIFSGLYDDEPDEPDVAIRDLLADLFHEAAARGVDLQQALRRAVSVYEEERDEWAQAPSQPGKAQ